jgi:hypothetical protein
MGKRRSLIGDQCCKPGYDAELSISLTRPQGLRVLHQLLRLHP